MIEKVMIVSHFLKNDGAARSSSACFAIALSVRRFVSNQTQAPKTIADKVRRIALKRNKSISLRASFITAIFTPQINATSNKLTSARGE